LGRGRQRTAVMQQAVAIANEVSQTESQTSTGTLAQFFPNQKQTAMPWPNPSARAHHLRLSFRKTIHFDEMAVKEAIRPNADGKKSSSKAMAMPGVGSMFQS